MASSGTEKTGTLKGSLYVKFEWSVDNINTSARTGTLHYKVYCTRDDSQTTKYYVYDTNNYFKIDGVDVYRIVAKNDSSGHYKSNPYKLGDGGSTNPYKLYTSDSSFDKTTKTLTGYSSPLTDKQGFFLKVLAEGTKTINYDANGDGSFTIDGKFHCYDGNAPTRTISKTITLDRINVNSRANKTTNTGSNWDTSAYAYKTTDGGSSWVKCNLYRTTDAGATWTKIT